MGDAMNNVLDAIEILSNAQIKKSNSSTYLKAQIVSCEDSVLQKYKCKFQDSAAFYATTSIPFNKVIPKGTWVWILIPNNDYSQQKKIIGTVESLGYNYISIQNQAETYDLIGINTITSNEIYYLNTNNEEYFYTLYDCDKTDNDINIDIESLNEYLLQSSQLLIGAYFKTSIPAKRQNRGHYGITYELLFKDDNTNDEIIKTFTIDEDNMIDNPYRLLYETRQYKIFDIDSQNFIKVKSISIFNKDFPQAEGKTTNRKLNKGDIQISNIELCGAIKNKTYDNGLSISFYTPKGTFFTEEAISGDFKTITAYLKVNGLRVTDTEKLSFYWGREDIGISSTSQYYNSYLGRGWKCLNQNNIISGTSSNPTISWVPASDTFQISLQEASAKDNNIKVAIVYNNSVVTKTINIRNLGAITNISIISDGGVEFYHGVGHPKLTCQVEGNLSSSSYKYSWGVEDNNNNFLLLPQTTTENEIYNNAVDELNQLIYDINTGRKYKQKQEENIKQLEQKIQSYNYIQRVEGNIIHDVQINNIIGFSIFKCSVYSNKDVYLGTAAIILQNKTQAEALYTLIINNGTQVFQYNEQGIAPNNASLQNRQKIPILDFTLYDEVGNAIDSNIIKNNDKCSIRWSIPIKDTLLEDSGQNGQSSGFDSTSTFLYYENLTNFSYNIKQIYNIQAENNQIELTINYNGLTVTTRTNFTFVKQGQPGTNGSQYVIKIIPNTLSNNIPYFPMIINRNGGYYLNYGLNSTGTETEINTDKGRQLFKAQVWNNGELLWEGFSIDNGIGTAPNLIHWSILSNKYSSLYQDESAFEVTNPLSGFIRYTGKFFSSITDRENPYSYANIIQCSVVYNGKTYYGTIPVITAITFDPNYNIKLQDFTGFKYVLYSSSGTTPQYDNTNPFIFVCQQKMDGIWVESKNIQYIPSSIGSIKNNKTGTIIDKSNLLQLVQYNRQDLQNNQWYYQPAINYDGQCVNLAVLCKIKKNGTTMGHIHIPIHFLLNKYGLANINGWDGNSIQINENGGYILTPQIGSGQKDKNNNFTGILMGSVKESSADNIDNIYQGLLAYNKGERSFFLNAKNGSVIFGKNGGKLTIDPNNQKMMIYSSNFWNQYKDDGLPISYDIINENQDGLLIDLTTPQIRYGNGNFSISNEGILSCINANISGTITASNGTIGGWTINENMLSRIVSNSQTIDNETIDEDSDGEGEATDSSSDITVTSTVTLDDSGIIFNGTLNGENIQTSIKPIGIYTNSITRPSGHGLYQWYDLTGQKLWCIGNNKEILRFATKTTATTPSTNRGISFMIGNGYYTVGSGTNHQIKTNNVNVYLCGGTDETSKYIQSYPTYKRVYSGSQYTANMYITDAGTFGRTSSSSIRYKHDVEYLTNENNSSIDDQKKIFTLKKNNNDQKDIMSILNIPIVKFKYNKGYITGDSEFDYNKSILGLISEDVANICPQCATYIQNENKEKIPEAYNINQIVIRMLYIIQQQQKEIEELKQKLT